MKTIKLPARFTSTINSHPVTLFRSRIDALEIARANAADETDGWNYKVCNWPGDFYVVQVFDSANTFVGTL